MPELPEVEIFKRRFDLNSLNKEITGVEILSPSLLKGIKPEVFIRELKGKRFVSSLRHGKYLFAGYDKDKHIVFHFGMSGDLNIQAAEKELSKHTRISLNLNNNSVLEYINIRKFGAVSMLSGTEEFIKAKKMGEDPVNSEISYKRFMQLAESAGNVKRFLMNQSKIAGIGNIYSDEILFQAEINPESDIKELTDQGMKAIYSKMMKILKDSIAMLEKKGKLPDHYLAGFRKKNSVCPLCGGSINTKKIGGRTSYFCIKHQKKV